MHTYDYNCTMGVHALLCISVGRNFKVHVHQIYVIVQEMGGFQVCRKVCSHVYEMTVTRCGFVSVYPCVEGVSSCSFNKNDIQCFCMKCGHAFINLSIGIYLLVLDNSFFKKKGRFHSLGLPLFEELRSRVSSAFRLGYMDP